jgi:hypothetical protein
MAKFKRRQERGGTAAALMALNEIPLRNEIVIEADTGKMKFGDGTTHYNDLPYLTGSGGGGAAAEASRRTATRVRSRFRRPAPTGR